MDRLERDDDTPPPKPAPVKRRRAWLKRAVRVLAACLVLAAGVLLAWFRSALYHHWVDYPRREAALRTLRAQRLPLTNDLGWNEYRGVLHSHSLLSHDSQVAFDQIHLALKTAGVDFICLSDHPNAGVANFDLQWRGVHDGILFIPGFEMKEGMMPFGVAPGVVLSNQTDSATLARQISESGGLLFYAHPEEPRDWSRAELTGIEIYNIHSDFKRAAQHPFILVPNILINQSRYPEQVLHSLFTRPTRFLQRWDELNRTRHITGIAGNDCHQNVGWRGLYTTNRTLLIEDTSPRKVRECKLNWLTRSLARVCFGPLEPNRVLFHVQLDPYERMARFVNTHVLANELTEPTILASLKIGRVFVAFDSLADSSGFRWFAADGQSRIVMGETATMTPETRLQAIAPLPCRFTVLRAGHLVCQQEGRSIELVPPGPGNYRVEAELKVRDTWVPWVYANPIYLQ